MKHLPIKLGYKKLLLLGGTAVIAVGSIIFVIYHYSTNNKGALIPSSSTTTKSSTNSDGQTTKLSSSGGSSSSNGSNTNNTSSTASGSTLAPDAPWGNFISNHAPGADSSPTQEQSICNTTPGASCYIKFTNAQNGEIKSLATQTTDSGGNTNWVWDVKQAGLSSGAWNIAAVATLNGQTKTTKDIRDLVIQ